MHNRLQLTIAVLIMAVCIQGLLTITAKAQSATQGGDGSDLMSSVYQGNTAEDSNMILLTDLLHMVEENFNVTFLYEQEFMANKIVNRNHINMRRMGQQVGLELSDILIKLGFTYQRIDDHTYVILSKPFDNEISIIQETVQGLVTDAQTGEPLPGVTIMVLGTNTGVATDMNGEFELTVQDLEVTLVFSYIGYETVEIPLEGRSELEVTLSSAAILGDELVVVGFGERRVKDLTASISSVDATAIERLSSTSPQYALQGRTTGVRVVNTSGNPNEAPQIFVRGIGTWNGDAQPLYVIDGQIYEPPRDGNQDVISGGGLSTPPNLFNLLNSQDIESMTVLKDASAAAIYGSRAANGVVLITTKRGRAGAPTIEFSQRYSIQNTPTYNVLNSDQFVDINREMYANNVNPDVTVENNLYGRNEPADANRMTSFNPQFDPQSPFYISDRTTYNWQDELTRNDAVLQTYNLRVSGGTGQLDYYVSGGYNNQQGIMLGNEMESYSATANLNVQATDWWKIGVNYRFTHQESLLNDNGVNLQSLATVAPWQPLRDSNHPLGFAQVIDPYRFGDSWSAARIYGQASSTNYLARNDINRGGFDISRNIGQIHTEFTPIEGLLLRGSLNLDYTQQDRYTLNQFSVMNYFMPNGQDPATVAANAPNSAGSRQNRINNILNYQSDFTAIYNLTLAERHRITITGAVQDQRHERETVNLETQNITRFVDDIKLTGYGNNLNNNNSFYGWNRRFWFGMVGRVNYDFDNKYYLDVSYRRDASSGFDKDYRWGNFYAVSAAWRISQESFFDVSFIDDLKVRGGWGEAGNDQAAVGRYAYLSGVSTGLSSYSWGSGTDNPTGNWQGGGLVNDLPNPELSWEVVTTTSVGLDAYMFNDKINMTFEWYNRVTDGILQSVDLPITTGISNPLANIGKLENKGIDLLLGYRDQIGSVNFNVSGNISFVNNKVLRLYQDQPLSTGLGRVEVGRSIGHIWGYRVGGIFQTQQEIDDYFAQFDDQTISNRSYVQPGDMYFLDVQGNPTDDEPFYSTTPDGLINQFDQTEIGNTIPGYTYGINLEAGWKWLDVNMSFYGEGDVQKFNDVRRSLEHMQGVSNFASTTLNRWTPDNRDTDMPRAVAGDPAGNNRFSDRYVESAAFFRLNNWQIGYTVPVSVLERFDNVVRNIRIYVGGQNNLYRFRWSGVDPVNDAVPLPRTYSFGIDIRF